MGITATAVAKRNKLKRNAEWRANRRATSDVFLKAEQQSRAKYNEFTNLSREFAKTYPNEFKLFLQAKMHNGSVARQSFGLPRHIPATTLLTSGLQPATLPATMATPLTGILQPPVRLPDFGVVSSGRIPSAQQNESRRIDPAASGTLAQLGIRLD
jgi:hypothetical protein